MNKHTKKQAIEDKGIRIITNNHWYKIMSGYELSDKQKRIMNYIKDIDDEIDCFFIYRGTLYYTGDFMNLHNKIYEPIPPAEFNGYDGYSSDSFFSGVLVRYPKQDDYEHEGYIQVALYLS